MVGASSHQPPITESFNTTYFSEHRTPSSATFHPFIRLPAELRLQIWEHALPVNRLLLATLVDGAELPNGGYRHTNHLGNIVGGDHYELRMSTESRNDRLLATCREARRVALEYFRLRVPLLPGRPYSARLYLNPDRDYLYIWQRRVATPSLVGLLHDLRAYDPRGQGLHHLVCHYIELREEYDDPHPLSEDALSPTQLCSFKQSLMALRTVWLATHVEPCRADEFGDAERERNFFNRALPSFDRGGEFHLLDRDPRLPERLPSGHPDCGEHWMTTKALQTKHTWLEWASRVLEHDPEIADGEEYLESSCEFSVVLCKWENRNAHAERPAEGSGLVRMPPVDGFWVLPWAEVEKSNEFTFGSEILRLDFDRARFSLACLEPWGPASTS